MEKNVESLIIISRITLVKITIVIFRFRQSSPPFAKKLFFIYYIAYKHNMKENSILKSPQVFLLLRLKTFAELNFNAANAR